MGVDICIGNEHLNEKWEIEDGVWINCPHSCSDEFVRNVQNASQIDDLIPFLKSTKTEFGLICEFGNTLYCICDHVRTIPLYYAVLSDGIYVSDDAQWIVGQMNRVNYPDISQAEFLATGYVTGHDTLVDSLNQVRAGEIVSIDMGTGDTDSREYFTFHSEVVKDDDRGSLVSDFERTLDRIFDRLIERADGRQLVVPLSAGYDSRLIALMLNKKGYENVLTYSHGRVGNAEMTVAREVAENIGFKWKKIEYTNDRWWDWFHSDQRRAYYREVFDYASLPGIVHMNWPAVKVLVEGNVVDEDCIFVPGHTGMGMTQHLPTYYTETDSISKNRLVSDLFDMNYWLWDFDSELTQLFKSRLADSLPDNDSFDPRTAVAEYERWEWFEREAKWTNADLDVYRFFDREFALPLWDKELMSLWNCLPISYKENKEIAQEYVTSQYIARTGVSEEEATKTELQSPIRRTYYWLRDSPVFELIRPINSWIRYRNDPSAWPGVMPERTFKKIYTGKENRHAFFGLAILEMVDFQTGSIHGAPTDGTLTLAHVQSGVNVSPALFDK